MSVYIVSYPGHLTLYKIDSIEKLWHNTDMSDFQRILLQNRLKRAEALVDSSLGVDPEEEEEEEEDGLGDLPDMKSHIHKSVLRTSGNVGSQAQKRELKLPSWSEYFSHDAIITDSKGYKFQTYYNEPIIGSESDPDEAPVVIIAHHGAGSSGLTFSKLSRSIKRNCQTSRNISVPGFFSFDCRGHGKTRSLNEEGNDDISITTLCSDFSFIMNHFVQKKFLNSDNVQFRKPSIFLLGHSLGGAVLTKCVHEKDKYITKLLYDRIQGLVMLDIVEETAIRALSSMNDYLSSVPRSFSSLEDGINWHLSSGLLHSRESAMISVPDLLTKNDKTNEYEWTIDLHKTEKFWPDWFIGLSSNFISLSNKVAKMLVLANHDNLDKYLMIGQMQGKYQLIVFRGDLSSTPMSETLTTATTSVSSGDCKEVGHFIHEDVPDKLAISLLEFIERNDYGNSRSFGGGTSEMGTDIGAQMKHLNELNKKWGVKRS